MEVELSESKRTHKRMQAKFMMDGKMRTIHFGDDRYINYTIHHDEKKRDRYKKRHIFTPTDGPMFPGFWSLNILWNKRTINASVRDVERRFGMKITNLYVSPEIPPPPALVGDAPPDVSESTPIDVTAE